MSEPEAVMMIVVRTVLSIVAIIGLCVAMHLWLNKLMRDSQARVDEAVAAYARAHGLETKEQRKQRNRLLEAALDAESIEYREEAQNCKKDG